MILDGSCYFVGPEYYGRSKSVADQLCIGRKPTAHLAYVKNQDEHNKIHAYLYEYKITNWGSSDASFALGGTYHVSTQFSTFLID